ncbi:Non-catalytic module family EXPN protein [Mycena vitilis]|nr:Non-catalytic module family EXPN protein [Mycena vitilis]
MRFLSLSLFALSTVSLPATTAASAISHSTSSRAIAKSKYSESHSLGDSYTFDPRDGWQTLNASSEHYKYRRESTKKQKTAVAKPKSGGNTLSGIVAQAFGAVWHGLQGKGLPKKVTVTWYTGHDLENPSCWSNTNWAPTDESFVCALTLQGWLDKPQCFDFLELCNGPQKCVFIRVVDTCAGCAKASHHVDLTQAPFRRLASLDKGVVEMNVRPATKPNEWFEDMWGPQK